MGSPPKPFHMPRQTKRSVAELDAMVPVDKLLPLNTGRYHRNREDGSSSSTLGSASSPSPASSPASSLSSSTSSSSVSSRPSAAKLPPGSPILRYGEKPRILVQCCRGLFKLT